MKPRLLSLLSLVLICPSVPLMAAQEEARAPEGKELTVEQFLQGLSSVPGIFSRKDPFLKAAPPFEGVKTNFDDQIVPTNPVLQRYPLKEYTVIAVLIGNGPSRALVKVPEQNQAYIVREKDKFGSKGGIISKISKAGVTVIEKKRSPLGFIDKTEVTLAIKVKDEQAGGAAKPQ